MPCGDGGYWHFPITVQAGTVSEKSSGRGRPARTVA
jgi:hypothetical protein